MTVLSPDDVSFVPDRLFKLSSRDGVEPNQAVHVVRSACECPECGGSLDDLDVKDGKYVDRDVEWTDDWEFPSDLAGSSAHKCSTCGTRLRIMVEEKALGRLSKGSEHLPDDLEGSEIVFVPYDGGYVVINPHQVFIHAV